MKKLFSGMMLASAALAFQACNSNSSNSSTANADSANYTKDTSTSAVETGGIAVTSEDAEFAVSAANGGMAEVELAKLAEAKGTSPKVKEFAAMMIKDHTKANTELMALAKTKNITLPTTVGPDQQKIMDELSKKSGAEFDKGYIQAMVADHKKDVELFEKASTDSKDADLKSFAIKTLPVLKMHKQHVDGIEEGMK